MERLVLNVFVGESGDRFISRTYKGERSVPPGMTITFALVQTVGKIAERSSTKSRGDGVDYE